METQKTHSASWSDIVNLLAASERGGEGNPAILDCVYDSRQVKPGTVFVAVSGFTVDGFSYIPAAVAKGASAVIAEKTPVACPVPWVRVNDARAALGLVSKFVWRVSLDTVITAGVTGTNGKTTTTHLLHNLFAAVYGEKTSWMAGTIHYRFGNEEYDATRTTPESADLFRRIGQAAEKPRAVAMEVSSHALDLNRIAGFSYDLAVWTNLTQDHLDFHGTMERYYQSKKRLFTAYMKTRGCAIINIDDPWGRRLADELGDRRIVTYGQSSAANVRIVNSVFTGQKTELTLAFDEREKTYVSSLVGAFNAHNAAAFCASAYALGIPDEPVRAVLAAAAVPGRMELIETSLDASIIVDYAHTPDALEKVLAAARELTKRHMLCLFGCGGDRDSGKRPLMAAAVSNNADEAIVTSDNPRSEKPEAIIEDILDGMPLDFPVTVVVDRKEAIARALSLLKPGDCLVIAGKGHETYQESGGIRKHFDDREIVREIAGAMRTGAGQ